MRSKRSVYRALRTSLARDDNTRTETRRNVRDFKMQTARYLSSFQQYRRDTYAYVCARVCVCARAGTYI